MQIGTRVTGSLKNPKVGTLHFTGVITDIGGEREFVAVLCDDGETRYAELSSLVGEETYDPCEHTSPTPPHVRCTAPARWTVSSPDVYVGTFRTCDGHLTEMCVLAQNGDEQAGLTVRSCD